MATFTKVTKHKLSWSAPAVTARTVSDRFLSIGSGFSLLIGNSNKLIIQPGQAGTTWTEINKTR
jgi:hypothetical protein